MVGLTNYTGRTYWVLRRRLNNVLERLNINKVLFNGLNSDDTRICISIGQWDYLSHRIYEYNNIIINYKIFKSTPK